MTLTLSQLEAIGEQAVAGLGRGEWIGIAAALAAFATLVAALKIVSVTMAPHPEWVRKFLHVGSGLLTLTFPALFAKIWPVLILTGTAALFLGGIKFLPSWRRRLGDVLNGEDRRTLGEIYFPLSVAAVFSMMRWQHESPLFFAIPVLVLTVADAACALVGIRSRSSRHSRPGKTLEGSLAFFGTACACISGPLYSWGNHSVPESLLVGAILALILTFVERWAQSGTDNLFIPLVGYFLLHPLVTLDGTQLQVLGGIALTWLLAVALIGDEEKPDAAHSESQ